MTGREGFTLAMEQIANKIMELHRMEEDWVTAASILYEVSRLSMHAAKCADEAAGEAEPRIPAAGWE